MKPLATTPSLLPVMRGALRGRSGGFLYCERAENISKAHRVVADNCATAPYTHQRRWKGPCVVTWVSAGASESMPPCVRAAAHAQHQHPCPRGAMFIRVVGRHGGTARAVTTTSFSKIASSTTTLVHLLLVGRKRGSERSTPTPSRRRRRHVSTTSRSSGGRGTRTSSVLPPTRWLRGLLRARLRLAVGVARSRPPS